MKLNNKKFDIILATKCMSAKDLSKKSGVNVITLSKLRNGSVARPQTIGRLAAALEVDVTELIEN
ncbi:MAG TPA: helix-turn-helix transcriptional regulator [Clostridiales bacterium]|nr:helix-turn-helix transcriptional regulator [Clostridiales bacterium]